MRPTQIAALALSPMLLVASAVASPLKTDAVTSEPARISTGIVAAQIDSPNGIHIPASVLGRASAIDSQVVLSLNVDEKGNPRNVHVVKSANPDLDSRVVAAVSQSHFHPATLNHQAIPIDMKLVVQVQH